MSRNTLKMGSKKIEPQETKFVIWKILLAIGRLFYEENREMLLDPGKARYTEKSASSLSFTRFGLQGLFSWGYLKLTHRSRTPAELKENCCTGESRPALQLRENCQ
ncbi:hypothetical protein TNCV_4298661 [Trichonephila clavipes]|nr:hypothetical protein TNCV_4298661 [Trichonephila clavipes]